MKISQDAAALAENLPEQTHKQKYFIAKSLYLRGMSFNEIVRNTSIPPKTLEKWRLGMACHGDHITWAEEKAKAIADTAREQALNSRADLVDIFAIGCDLIKKSLQHRAKQDEPLDMREAKLLSEIITSLDKMNRLEVGKPTEIIEDAKPISLQELRDAVLKDKFASIIDAEATPVDNSKPSGA